MNSEEKGFWGQYWHTLRSLTGMWFAHALIGPVVFVMLHVLSHLLSKALYSMCCTKVAFWFGRVEYTEKGESRRCL